MNFINNVFLGIGISLFVLITLAKSVKKRKKSTKNISWLDSFYKSKSNVKGVMKLNFKIPK